MKIQIVNNDGESLMFDIFKYDKKGLEQYTKNHINYELEYIFHLEDKDDKKFISMFINKSDELHLNIIYNSENIYRVYNPQFNITTERTNTFLVKTIM